MCGTPAPAGATAGRLQDFAACYGRIRAARIRAANDKSAALDAQSVSLLGIEPGATFLAMER